MPGRLTPVGRGGRYWFAVAEPEHGGDEAPAAAVLARVQQNGTGEVLASPGVPEIGQHAAWRVRFNYRGLTNLLFHAAETVTVAVRADGPPVDPKITTLDGAVLDATGDGRAAQRWSLSAGWYRLALGQVEHAEGILDLTLGPPGLLPRTPVAPGPPDPTLSLGEQYVQAERLKLIGNEAPGQPIRKVARALPLELDDGPMLLTLAAGQSEDLDVRVKRAGTLLVRALDSDAPIERSELSAGVSTRVTLPAADHPRTLAVAWLPPDMRAVPAPSPPPDLPVLQDGATSFLDLQREKTASFALQVAEGGLFRATTLGRLHTGATIGTSFLPTLDSADGNGVGANMLLQRYLRAGRYRLNVVARGSEGRLGVVVAPAPMLAGAALLPGLSVRASLPAGSGVAFPLRIAQAGRYHLDLHGLGGRFAARLEDAEGWPLLRDGDLTSLDTDLAPGLYRLIVEPPAVAARVVARLARIVPPAPIEGHGPHTLPFDAVQSATWREPASPDAEREPDAWSFALAGPANISLDLTGEGMAAQLLADARGAKPLATIEARAKMTRTLPAGRYRVEVRASERNDRVDYRLSLQTEELQPGTPRQVHLPAVLSFAIAEPRIVSLSSFGDIPLRAVLRGESGGVLARAAERTDDWNIALSRPLPAGRYRLELAALASPAAAAPVAAAAASDAEPTQSNDQDNADQTPQAAAGPAPPPAPAVTGGGGSSSTEVTLALVADLPDEALAADGSAQIAGVGVHHLPLPTRVSGKLMLVAAESPIEVSLAVEARDADGAWRRIAQDQGTAPIVAIPTDGGAWRALAWSVDGADAPIRLAAAAADSEAQALGALQFRPASPGSQPAGRWPRCPIRVPRRSISPGRGESCSPPPAPAARRTAFRPSNRRDRCGSMRRPSAFGWWRTQAMPRSRARCRPSNCRAIVRSGSICRRVAAAVSRLPRRPMGRSAASSPPPSASPACRRGAAWRSRTAAPSRCAAATGSPSGTPAGMIGCARRCAATRWHSRKFTLWTSHSPGWCRRTQRCRCGCHPAASASMPASRPATRWSPTGRRPAR